MKFNILIVKMLFVGALFIISNQNLYMSVAVDRQIFYDLYFNWINTLFDQAFEVSGYVVKFEWLPSNNGTVDIVLKANPGNFSGG